VSIISWIIFLKSLQNINTISEIQGSGSKYTKCKNNKISSYFPDSVKPDIKSSMHDSLKTILSEHYFSFPGISILEIS